MRKRLIAVVAIVTACASASPPPGGPEDKVPPRLMKVTPDTNAVNVKDEAVSFFFDETISDRGAQEVDSYFIVSPSDGAARVDWHRSRIDVRPRHGFKPNTAYTITMLPGLTDLSHNIMKSGASLTFSTGPTIPKLRLEGIAFDWVQGKPARAWLEAITPDSVIYLAQTDSTGRFVLGPLLDGTYLVKAYTDQNNNRALDRGEMFDTLRLRTPVTGPVELLMAIRDTLPAHMSVPVVVDSVTLTVGFDRMLDPAQTLDAKAFRLLASDSSETPVVSALSPRDLRRIDSLVAKTRSDSIRRADSVAGKPVAPPPAPPAIVPSLGGRDAKAPATPLPTPSKSPPFSSVTLKLGRPLVPNSDYRLSVSHIRALSGRDTSSVRRFSTPKPPPPKPGADSLRGRPPRDSTRPSPIGCPSRPPPEGP